MATMIHMGFSVAGMRKLLRDQTLLKRSGTENPGELVELATQLAKAEQAGKQVLSACPTPLADGGCPGHST